MRGGRGEGWRVEMGGSEEKTVTIMKRVNYSSIHEKNVKLLLG